MPERYLSRDLALLLVGLVAATPTAAAVAFIPEAIDPDAVGDRIDLLPLGITCVDDQNTLKCRITCAWEGGNGPLPVGWQLFPLAVGISLQGSPGNYGPYHGIEVGICALG